jgi:glyoxylase-like metal-dependent hydrolase (beta-lactamase superfamily II)
MAMAQTLQLIAEDLWFWEAYEEAVRAHLSSCAVRAESGLVIVDPIDLSPEGWTELTRLGPVAAVVLTNGNHARSASRFRTRLSVPILAHPDALGELEVPVDGVLSIEKRVGGSLEVLALPGGGPGEIALRDPRGRLHLGDALVHLESTGLSVLPEKYCRDARQLALSLRALLGMRLDVLTFAHGQPILGQVSEKLSALLG